MATAAKKKSIDIDDVPTNTRNREPRVDDLVGTHRFQDKKWTKIRGFGELVAKGQHWVQVKKQDGSKGNFSTRCLAFDPSTGRVDSTRHCPWCDFMDTEHNQVAKGEKRPVSLEVSYYVNAVIMDLVKQGPEVIKPTKEEQASMIKDKDSDTFTPIRVVRIPKSLLLDIRNQKQLNVHEVDDEEKTFSLLDLRYGQLLNILYDKDREAAKQYTLKAGDTLPLPLKKKNWLRWDLDLINPDVEDEDEALEEATKEMKKWAKRHGFDDAEEDKPNKRSSLDDEDMDDPKEKPKSKKKPAADDFDDEADEDGDEEPEEKPKSKKKPAADDFDDEELEEKPKGKKKPVDVDDDLDEPEEKPKSKKKPAADDFDEDEPEEKPKARTKKPAADEEEPEEKSKKPKKKPANDDDDFEF